MPPKKRTLSAEVRRTQVIKEKAAAIELRIKNSDDPPNLNPEVRMKSLRLPADLERGGVNLHPMVNIKRIRISDFHSERCSIKISRCFEPVSPT